MQVTLVGRDFDFSGNDGISRYSFEIYNELLMCKRKGGRSLNVDKISVIDFPLLRRAINDLEIKDSDIIHLMYPNPIGVAKTMSKMITTWHDNRVFTRSETVPLLSRRFYRERAVKRISLENYSKSDAIISVSSKTEKELKAYLAEHGIYDDGKQYFVVNEGIDDQFLKQRIWRGQRKDFGYIGAIHLLHKNLPALLKVFNAVASESNDVRLHIFTLSPDADKILARSIENYKSLSAKNVILHYRTPDSEILKYLPKMVGYLHLSKTEGFGLPIMEALAVGTMPMILGSSDIPEEVRKYAFKSNVDGLIKEALAMLDTPKPASDSAIRYARSFTWQKAALDTLNVYEKMTK